MIEGLLEWLERQKLERGILRLQHHAVHGMVVQEWDVRADEDIPRLATTISSIADADASCLGGVHTYQLVYLVDKQPRASLPFRINAPVENDALQVVQATPHTDVATALLQQSHGHIEVLTKSLVAVALGTAKSHLAEINRLVNRVEELEQRIETRREEHERSLDTNFARNQQSKKFDADQRRLDEGISTVRTLAPFIVNAIAKRQMVPTGDTSLLKEALRPAMESLTEEQLKQLEKVLTPSQLISLLQVWQLLAKDAKEKPDGEK